MFCCDTLNQKNQDTILAKEPANPLAKDFHRPSAQFHLAFRSLLQPSEQFSFQRVSKLIKSVNQLGLGLASYS